MFDFILLAGMQWGKSLIKLHKIQTPLNTYNTLGQVQIFWFKQSYRQRAYGLIFLKRQQNFESFPV